jgi:hypothetical protein
VSKKVTDKEIIKHMHSIIQYLRNAFVHFQFEETIEKPLKLWIDDNLKLYIGNNEIELEALQKTIYYFSLMNQDGFKVSELRNKSSFDTIENLYQYLKEKNPRSIRQNNPIYKLCGKDIKGNIIRSSFYDTKSKCNSSIIQNIDSSIQHLYVIKNINGKSKKDSTFRIELHTEHMSIDVLNKYR